MKQTHIRIAVGTLLAVFAALSYAGIPLLTPEQFAGLSMIGGLGTIELVTKALGNIENQLATFSTKAENEAKLGQVSADTKAAIEGLGTQQHELATRLLAIEQKSTAQQDDQGNTVEGWGQQFTKAAEYKGLNFSGGRVNVGVEVKNTSVTSDVTVAPDRKPGVVGGAFRILRLEDILNAAPTSSSSIEYTRENVFTNAAAGTAEGAQMPESSITFALDNVPVQAVAHMIKISRQLAADNAALAAYINGRLRHGVDLHVENQLYAGNGTSPNLSGLAKSGNYTAHGYTAAALTALGLSPTNRMDLIGKVLGDCESSDYPATAVLLNPADWWTMRLAKDTQGRYLLGDPDKEAPPMIWGVPVVKCSAVTADTFQVGAYNMAATKYDREGVIVELSDSDGDNFQKMLVTVRAVRRLALAVERPASIRGGDLTPA